jgi:hypothetical protein
VARGKEGGWLAQIGARNRLFNYREGIVAESRK